MQIFNIYNLVSFDTCIESWNQCHNQVIEYYQLKGPIVSLCGLSLLPVSTLTTTYMIFMLITLKNQLCTVKCTSFKCTIRRVLMNVSPSQSWCRTILPPPNFSSFPSPGAGSCSHWSALCHCSLFFLELHINGIMQYVAFEVLLSISAMLLRSNNVSVVFFFFIAE